MCLYCFRIFCRLVSIVAHKVCSWVRFKILPIYVYILGSFYSIIDFHMAFQNALRFSYSFHIPHFTLFFHISLHLIFLILFKIEARPWGNLLNSVPTASDESRILEIQIGPHFFPQFTHIPHLWEVCHYTIFYSESFGTPELLVRILHKHRSAFPFRYSVFDKEDQFIGYTFLWKIYMSILNLIFIYVSFYRPLRSCLEKWKRQMQFYIQLCGILNKMTPQRLIYFNT